MSSSPNDHTPEPTNDKKRKARDVILQEAAGCFLPECTKRRITEVFSTLEVDPAVTQQALDAFTPDASQYEDKVLFYFDKSSSLNVPVFLINANDEDKLMSVASFLKCRMGNDTWHFHLFSRENDAQTIANLLLKLDNTRELGCPQLLYENKVFDDENQLLNFLTMEEAPPAVVDAFHTWRRAHDQTMLQKVDQLAQTVLSKFLAHCENLLELLVYALPKNKYGEDEENWKQAATDTFEYINTMSDSKVTWSEAAAASKNVTQMMQIVILMAPHGEQFLLREIKRAN